MNTQKIITYSVIAKLSLILDLAGINHRLSWPPDFPTNSEKWALSKRRVAIDSPIKTHCSLVPFLLPFFSLKLPLRNRSSDIRASNQAERVISAGRVIPIYRPTNHTSTLAAITVEWGWNFCKSVGRLCNSKSEIKIASREQAGVGKTASLGAQFQLILRR